MSYDVWHQRDDLAREVDRLRAQLERQEARLKMAADALHASNARAERQEAACAHCAYCVMTQDAAGATPPNQEDALRTQEYHAVDPRMCRVACGGGPCKAPPRDALSTPPNQKDMPCVCRDDEGSTPGDYGVHYHQEEARKK